MSGRYIERVILGEDRGFLSWVIRGLLWPLSLIYRIGLAVYLSSYKIGIRKRYKLPVYVISVGNLTFGGTGKTPAVQTICRALQEAGKRVVILSRGHGGAAKGCLIVSDGKSVLCNSEESGDEPMLLARTLPGVPVVVGKDRRQSGKLACDEFKPDIIALDDGLQYWQLYRDLDIVVLDAAKPFGSGFVMPMGDLREPVRGLKRAGVILLNSTRGVNEHLVKRVPAIAPQAEMFRCAHESVNITDLDSGSIYGLGWLKNKKLVAFCGIGKPASFMDMLESFGASLEKTIAFPDHHNYTQEDVELIERESASSGAEAIITTEKDAARLGENQPIRSLYTLNIKLEIEDSLRFANRINREN